MPFPLERLPYGLRRRLRELCTPLEAYHIQIAAPNYDGFQPLIKIVHAEHLSYSQNENIFEAQQIRVQKNLRCEPTANTFFYTRDITLWNCTNASNTVSVFNNVCFTSLISLKNCTITKELIDCIVDHVGPTLNGGFQTLLIEDSGDSTLSAGEICNQLLPSQRSISFSSFPFSQNWILNDFKEVKDIKYLQIIAGIDFLDVDPTEFYNFFMAQDQQFDFFIRMDNYEESYSFTKLQTFLSEHFESVPCPEEIWEEGDLEPQWEHPSPCLHITINFDDEYLYIPKISEAEKVLREKKRINALREKDALFVANFQPSYYKVPHVEPECPPLDLIALFIVFFFALFAFIAFKTFCFCITNVTN